MCGGYVCIWMTKEPQSFIYQKTWYPSTNIILLYYGGEVERA